MGYGSGPDSTGAPQRGSGLRWDLVVDIALDVWRTGSHLVSVWELGDLRDVRAAATQAARLVGAVAHLEELSSGDRSAPPELVRICFADPDGTAWRCALERLDALHRAVRRQLG